MIDLNKLRAFLYAAESLSFSKAARRMHLTQPTVSHHIKSLEIDMRVELFDRSGSELQLTEAGRILQPWARKCTGSKDFGHKGRFIYGDFSPR
jgi:DNA-binding transcriptional LysR family regulator